MENTMASSNVDDKLKKDTENKETGNKTECALYYSRGIVPCNGTYFSKGRISETATEWTECCGNRGSFRGIR